jgi:hypothetical protein
LDSLHKEYVTMTTDTLSSIRTTAKRLARQRRIKHIDALEIAAVALGHPHWRGLMEATKKGWSPTSASLEKLESLLDEHPAQQVATEVDITLETFGEGLRFTRWLPDDVAPMEADEIHGELDWQTFYLVGDEFSVAIGSQGWEIILDQQPSAKPELRRLGWPVKSVAALDANFVERATQLLSIRARRMHAEVARHWSRRSTMPDKEGRARHPLTNDLSAEWYCLHCDGAHDGAAMARNLWHCPHCGATPIDIFSEPFWNKASTAG